MSVDTNRPNPLGDAARKVSTIWAGISVVLGALAALGILNAAQADAINAAGAQIPPSILAIGALAGAVIPLVTSVASAFHTAAAAKPSVTPVDDPRNDHGHPLAPVISGLEA